MLLWIVGFLAFLLAPLFVLGLAWVVGLAVLAVRHRNAPSSHADADAHRFGSAAAHPEEAGR